VLQEKDLIIIIINEAEIMRKFMRKKYKKITSNSETDVAKYGTISTLKYEQ